MRDVQSELDHRRIDIDRVGLRGVKLPISIISRDSSLVHTVAEVDMAVDLPHSFRGIHMSRLIEEFEVYRHGLDLKKLESLLQSFRERLEARVSYVRVAFPFFREKIAPISKIASPLSYPSAFSGRCDEDGADLTMEVKVPVTTLCPCSRALSEKGAHNQRGVIKSVVRFKGSLELEELIDFIEDSASCGIYSLLKRADEKYVTERAYSRPRFVEDVIREVAKRLDSEDRVTWYTVEAESHESIHDHEAYAFIKRDKNESKPREAQKFSGRLSASKLG